MALVDSLLTAMVRANGDALVMHVGERPYVVRESGTIDLSTQGLNLAAMTGMLAQLLPADAQNSLLEFGAVEHQLPSKDDDRFTVVAARGGDDIWIEIRRRRKPAAAAAPAIVAPVPEPVAAAPVAAPEPVVEPISAAMPEPELEAPPIVEVPQPPVIDEPLVEDEPLVIEEPMPAVAAVAMDEPIAIETPMAVEVPEPLAIAEPETEEVVMAEAPAAPAMHAVESVVLPMMRTVRIEVPAHVPSSRTLGVERLLRLAAARGASALYLTSDSKPYLRVEGDVRVLDDESVLTRADVEAAALEIGPEDAQELVHKGEATEWIAELPELGRIRCTSFQDHHGPGVLFRMIATRAATAEQLGLSREVQALATEAEGLVLVAGSRGTGKSTLISALVDLVNRQRADHVITLERQIRLVHDNRTALVSQREIRGGADEALAAARAALRENPDVLVVDDLSSAHMVPLLVEAAGQGLLVLVSITAPSTADAVLRFIELAPPEKRAAVQAGMSETFRGAVAQVLLKKTGGGRVTAREVLLGTASVTRLIADGQLTQLPLALESGRKHGMMPMTDALLAYVQSGVVDAREAFRKAHDRDRLVAGLKRAGIDTSAVERLA